MVEREVERHLINCVKARGGEVRKVKWIGRHSAPDRLVLLPGHHFLAELKRPGKGATKAQAREHVRLRAAGFEVLVLNNKNAINLLFCSIPLKGALGQ